MAERAVQLHSEGYSVPAFFSFRESLRTFARLVGAETKVEVPVMDGDTPLAARERMIADFQGSGGSRVIAIQLQTGGAGINLHDLAGTRPRFALISPDYSARHLVQALGRVHRAGGGKTTQEIVLADYPIELALKRVLDAKISAIETLTDMDLLSSLPFPA